MSNNKHRHKKERKGQTVNIWPQNAPVGRAVLKRTKDLAWDSQSDTSERTMKEWDRPICYGGQKLPTVLFRECEFTITVVEGCPREIILLRHFAAAFAHFPFTERDLVHAQPRELHRQEWRYARVCVPLKVQRRRLSSQKGRHISNTVCRTANQYVASKF